MSSTKALIEYFIPEDGDDCEHPNVYSIEKKIDSITLGDIIESFPIPGTYYFRFKSAFKKTFVWLDITDSSEIVPVFENTIVAKVSRIAIANLKISYPTTKKSSTTKTIPKTKNPGLVKSNSISKSKASNTNTTSSPSITKISPKPLSKVSPSKQADFIPKEEKSSSEKKTEDIMDDDIFNTIQSPLPIGSQQPTSNNDLFDLDFSSPSSSSPNVTSNTNINKTSKSSLNKTPSKSYNNYGFDGL